MKESESKILVLDTETTGLDLHAEILQFSAVWGDGTVAMNEYIKPTHARSWRDAMRVNGITPEMVKGKPTIRKMKQRIESLLNEANVIVGYNLPFDLGMLEQNGITLPSEDDVEYIDLMEPFARVYGEWSDYFEDFKWQKLVTCARYYGYKGSGWHDSLEDVKATLYCYNAMVERGDI